MTDGHRFAHLARLDVDHSDRSLGSGTGDVKRGSPQTALGRCDGRNLGMRAASFSMIPTTYQLSVCY